MKIRKKIILVQISLIFERIFKVTVTLIKIVEYYRTVNGLNSASFQKMNNFAQAVRDMVAWKIGLCVGEFLGRALQSE